MLRSDPEKLIRTTIARFVDNEVIPIAEELDKKGSFPRELFRQLAEMGVFGIRYPRSKGGAGGNTTLYCIICEELARGLLSLASITAMQCLMGTNFLFHYGSDEMREEYFLPAMRGEKIGCFCMTEPEAGSDLGAITTRAVEVDNGYLMIHSGIGHLMRQQGTGILQRKWLHIDDASLKTGSLDCRSALLNVFRSGRNQQDIHHIWIP